MESLRSYFEAAITQSPAFVCAYSCRERRYTDAFKIFASYTDQKTSAIQRLREIASGLSRRKLLVDVGAGTGIITAELSKLFDATIAIEPNKFSAEEIPSRCERVLVLREELFSITDALKADMVICSHVMFHISEDRWLKAATQMSDWLVKGGELCLLLQAPETDCRRLLDSFGLALPDLRMLLSNLNSNEKWRSKYQTSIETISSVVKAPHLSIATQIAEFMCNESSDFAYLPADALEWFVQAEFSQSTGHGFAFTCDQDLVRIKNL
jgi:SAM-dependent methyltransferase